MRTQQSTYLCLARYMYVIRVIVSPYRVLNYKQTRNTWRAQTLLAEADHYSHIATVKTLSPGAERLTVKVRDHYLHHDLVMLPLIWCFLLIYSSLNT